MRPKRERDEEDEEDAAESVRERERRESALAGGCVYTWSCLRAWFAKKATISALRE